MGVWKIASSREFEQHQRQRMGEDSGKVAEWATPDHQGSLVRVVALARSLFRGDLGNGMRLFVGARIDKKKGKDTGKSGNGPWRGANDQR
jgi:hypothetical protein